jgi:hypothetical protein
MKRKEREQGKGKEIEKQQRNSENLLTTLALTSISS